MTKIVVEIIGVCSLLAILTIVVFTEEAAKISKIFPGRAKEQYTIAPLTALTSEHYRFIRNGRYVTVCYWVSNNKQGTTQFSHCYTNTESFNGY